MEQLGGMTKRPRDSRSKISTVGLLGSSAIVAGGAASALLTALLAPSAGAASTWTVDSLGDSGTANASNCAIPNSGTCTLRDAIDAASAGDAIDFASGLTGTIAISTSAIVIGKPLTITGPGATNLTIDGQGLYQIFELCGAQGVVMSGLELANAVSSAITVWGSSGCGGGVVSSLDVDQMVFDANSGAFGGAINSHGPLTVRESTFSGNIAQGGGGAIYSYDATTIKYSTFESNTAGNTGAALYTHLDLTILGSTFSSNYSAGMGGAATIHDGGTTNVVIANTTATGNMGTRGGAFYFKHTSGSLDVELDQVTISGNSSQNVNGGNGIFVRSDVTLSMSGVIVSANPSAGSSASDIDSDAAVTLISDHSLVGTTGAGISLSGAGNVTSSLPLLGPLASNGGPTKTMELLSGSPAIDTGPYPTAAFTGDAFDQRGTGFLRSSGTSTDIGAFEVQSGPMPTSTTTTAPTTTTTAPTTTTSSSSTTVVPTSTTTTFVPTTTTIDVGPDGPATPAGGLPLELAPGAASIIFADGTVIPWPASADGVASVIVDQFGFGMKLTGERRADGESLALSAGGDGLSDGFGFLPNSRASVWLMSTPVKVADVTVSSGGTFTATFVVPADLVPGEHTVQMQGLAIDGSPRALALGVTVDPAHGDSQLPATGAHSFPTAMLGGGLLIGGAGAAAVAARRRGRRADLL